MHFHHVEGIDTIINKLLHFLLTLNHFYNHSAEVYFIIASYTLIIDSKCVIYNFIKLCNNRA